MLKIRYYQATVWDNFRKRPADEVYVYLSGNSDSLNYELTMMTLKGVYLLVASVILSMKIGLVRQCAK